ncbi:hypothetical protein KI387_016232, partial [Taxus chinensis]
MFVGQMLIKRQGGRKVQNHSEVIMDGSISENEELQGFIDLWKRMFGYMDSMGLRWAVELEIPDIISQGGLESMVSAEEIASHLPSPFPNIDFLSRILSFLAMRGIFTQTLLPNSQIVKYGLTPISKWLLKTRGMGCSMNPMVLMQTHEAVIAPWYRMADCTVSASGFPFEHVHGKLLFSFAKENPEFGKVFNDAMASHSKMLMKDILAAYNDGFSKLSFKSLLDVGGGDGSTIASIARAFPNIKCYNYDLPQVITQAPTYSGVEHIAGDMFLNVPRGDAILMK